MLEFLNSFLPVIIYILLIALITILIIMSLRFLKTLTKVDEIVDDVDDKVKSLDNFFSVMDIATDKIAFISDRVIDVISEVVYKVSRFTGSGSRRKRRRNKEDFYE